IATTNNNVVLMSKISSQDNLIIAGVYEKPQDEKQQTIGISYVVSDLRDVSRISSSNNTSGSVMPIYTGSSFRKRTKDEQVTFSYNVYILTLVELSEIYENILERIKI